MTYGRTGRLGTEDARNGLETSTTSQNDDSIVISLVNSLIYFSRPKLYSVVSYQVNQFMSTGNQLCHILDL